MFQKKTVIKITKVKDNGILASAWKIKRGKRTNYAKMGISRLMRLISTYIDEKDKVYDIEIVVKRKR